LDELRTARELLQPYFAKLKVDLLEKRSAALVIELERQQNSLNEIGEALAALRRDEADLTSQIAANGGDRLAVLSSRV
jgi:uncharacterized protein YPO0396